jgi:cytochrome b561
MGAPARTAAKVTHWLFYGLLFALPLTGWLMSSAANFPVSWFGLFTFPDLVAPSETLKTRLETVHEMLARALWITAALHVAAALKHHVLDRDDVLKRMLPWSRV